MELLLNTIWILVCGMAVVGLITHRRSSSGWRKFPAIACVLILLFPVISFTDDLFAAQLPLEDLSVSSELRSYNSAGLHLAGHVAFATPPALLLLPRHPLWLTTGLLDREHTSTVGSVFSTSLEGRAPPLA